MINFDNNATSPLTPLVKASLVNALEVEEGNPSSDNPSARRLRKHLQQSREEIAALINANPDEIYFVSGATEANNLVLRSVADRFPSCGIVSTQVEHASVLQTLEHLSNSGIAVELLAVDALGLIDLTDLQSQLDGAIKLVSVQWVNNETGIVQLISAISNQCNEANILLHVDAAQAVGRVEIDVAKTPVNYLSISGHKLHGPAGVGALYVRNGSPVEPMITGGDQECGLRAGTENWLGIIGFGCAIRERRANFSEAVRQLNELRRVFEEEIKKRLPEASIVGQNSPRAGNTSNINFAQVDGQALAIKLNESGVLCSQSSACHSQRPEPSHVLRAMGFVEKEAYACIRFSFSILNTLEEIEQAVEIIGKSVDQIKIFGKG